MNQTRLILSSFLLQFCFLSCGDAPKNSNLPPSASLITENNLPQDEAAILKRWSSLTTYLELSSTYQNTRADLVTSLATPPGTTSASHSRNSTLLQGVASLAIAKSPWTQCNKSSIAMKKIGTAVKIVAGSPVDVAADVYVMRFKTAKDVQGNVGDDDHLAIVTIPQTGGSYPVALYAHGGTAGIAYSEIAASLGPLQANHIVVAPSYPGEHICQSTDQSIQDCSGEPLLKSALSRSLYQGDVFELLAAQNCVALISSPLVTTFPTVQGLNNAFEREGTLANPLASKSAPHSTNGSVLTAYPVAAAAKTLTLGVDRGGLVAQLAVAYSGIYFSSLTSLLTSYPSFTPHPISALAVVASPATYLMGTYRIGLEHAFRGRIKNTSFANIPAFTGWVDILKPLLEASDEQIEEQTKAIAIQIAARDMLYMSGYLAAGLQNWTQKFSGGSLAATAGALGYFYGIKDVVVPYDQMLAAVAAAKAVNALAGVNAPGNPLASVPGFTYSPFAFQPYSGDIIDCLSNGLPSKCLKQGLYQHLDAAFSRSAWVASFSTGVESKREDSSYLPGEDAIAGALYGVNYTGTDNGDVKSLYKQGLRLIKAYTTENASQRATGVNPYSGDYDLTGAKVVSTVPPAAAMGAWRQFAAALALQ